MRQLLVIFLITLSLITPVSHAQNGRWTCDWGSADIINTAFAELEAGNFRRALELAELTREVCPDDDEHVAFSYFIQARVLSNQGQNEEAIRLYAQASDGFHELNIGYWEAYSLTEMGLIYNREGNYTDALASFEASLAINEQLGEDQEVAFVMAGIGDIYLARGNYEEALETYEEALLICRDIGYRSEEAYILFQLGTLYSEQGEFTEALVHYDQALAGFQDVEDQVMSAVTLNRMGLAYAYEGNYRESNEHFDRALIIFQEAEFPEWEITVLSNLGDNAFSTINYEGALEHYQQAIAITQELGDREREGDLLGSAGEVYLALGQYESALESSQQALAVGQELGDHLVEAAMHNLIGHAYWRRSQYGQALDAYNLALEAYQAIRSREGEANTLYNIGRAYSPQGEYDVALDNFQQALEIYQDVDDQFGERSVLNSIGAILFLQGRFDETLDILQQSLRLSRNADDRSSEASILGNMGLVYHDSGQTEEALEYIQQALEISQEIDDPFGEANALHNLGTVYREDGQTDRALELLEKGLEIGLGTGDTDLEQQLLVGRGRVYEQQGNHALAITDYTRAAQLVEALAFDLNPGSVFQSLLNESRGTYPHHALVRLLTLEGNAELALYYAERAKTLSMRTFLTTDAIDLETNAVPDMIDMEEEFRLDIVQAHALVNRMLGDTDTDIQTLLDAQQTLNTALQSYSLHSKTMQIKGGFIERELGLDVATLGEIQAVIADDSSIVVYTVSSSEIVAFVITAESLDATILEVGQETIDEQVALFESDRRAAEALVTLYDLLIKPIENQLTTSRLIIVPDGQLGYVPFAALTDATGDYLIDRYAISQLPSATTLVLLSDREVSQSDKTKNLVLAQPTAPNYPTLEHASEEAVGVAGLLDARANTNATESDLWRDATGSTVIHISAHAPLDPYAPLFSAIHLAQDEQHDGRFEIRDIYELDLQNGTDLVVLSGPDAVSVGDGYDYSTLTRAFFGAGAPRVMASLWSVDDVATAALLTTFIEQRSNFDNDADALQAAMLEVREIYPEPYLWAGFVMSGLPQ